MQRFATFFLFMTHKAYWQSPSFKHCFQSNSLLFSIERFWQQENKAMLRR